MKQVNKMTKGEKTRQQLYDCAIQLFREKGYEQVSVDEIVKAAGTAKGTFYIYFESKADILIYMLKEYDDYYDKVAADLDDSLSVEERLLIIAEKSVDFTQNVIGMDVIRVLYTNQLAGNDKGELYTERVLYRVLHKLVEEGQKEEVFNSDESSAVITNRMINCIRGVYFEWCIRNGNFDIYSECTNLMKLICRGLKK